MEFHFPTIFLDSQHTTNI